MAPAAVMRRLPLPVGERLGWRQTVTDHEETVTMVKHHVRVLTACGLQGAVECGPPETSIRSTTSRTTAA